LLYSTKYYGAYDIVVLAYMELDEFAVGNGESEIPRVASLHVAGILNSTLSPFETSKTFAAEFEGANHS